MTSKILRIIGLLCFLASFVLMICKVYGWILFTDVLVGILTLAQAAYLCEHKGECKPELEK